MRSTGDQYSVYRALLGAFLVVHFAMLLSYGAEVFGAGGTLSTAALSPYIGVLPNPLAWFDSPGSVSALPIVGIAAEPCSNLQPDTIPAQTVAFRRTPDLAHLPSSIFGLHWSRTAGPQRPDQLRSLNSLKKLLHTNSHRQCRDSV